MHQRYQLHLNGTLSHVACDGARSLLDCLREDQRLTGTKKGCGIGACGSCTVLIDGKPRRACRLTVADVGCPSPLLCKEGKGEVDPDLPLPSSPYKGEGSSIPEIVTIEGLSNGGKLHPIQQAFIDCGAIQCGFCTPGMVLSAKALLDANPRPTREEIRRALAGNLCRCTGYQQIFEAIEEAARRLRIRD